MKRVARWLILSLALVSLGLTVVACLNGNLAAGNSANCYNGRCYGGFGQAAALAGLTSISAANGATAVTWANATTSAQVTIEALIQPSTIGTVQPIYNDASFSFFISTAGQIEMDTPTSICPGSPGSTHVGGPTIAAGTKHYVAATFNQGASNQLIVYLDGTPVVNALLGTLGTNCVTTLAYIGTDGGTNHFNGVIDEVRISKSIETTGGFLNQPLACDGNQYVLLHFDNPNPTASACGILNVTFSGFSQNNFVNSPFP